MRPTGSADLDNCPVPEDLLKRLMEATLNAVSDIGGQLPENQRAALAVYCYRRAHFRRLGLSLAALCSRQALAREAGHAGELIHMQASNSDAQADKERSTLTRGSKPAVSLYVV
ncbi:hypothetical protein [Roseibium sp.]|uniref:hypothetical protein n=1 Tax=Roseibium sp. TaxID=1936156 RepID=UPI003D1293F9